MENELSKVLAEEASKQAAELGRQAAMGFFERIFVAYNALLDKIPEPYQWVVSLVVILAIINFAWRLIRRNWLWIVLAVVMFPGLLPVLKNFFDSLTVLLVGKKLDL